MEVMCKGTVVTQFNSLHWHLTQETQEKERSIPVMTVEAVAEI
jgi:hypothetical protein